MNEREIIILVVGLLCLIAVVFTFISTCKKSKDFIYVHIKTGNRYRIIQECQMKFDGKWMDAIAYMSERTYEMYVREYSDFVTHFKKLSLWEKEKK